MGLSHEQIPVEGDFHPSPNHIYSTFLRVTAPYYVIIFHPQRHCPCSNYARS